MKTYILNVYTKQNGKITGSFEKLDKAIAAGKAAIQEEDTYAVTLVNKDSEEMVINYLIETQVI